MTVKPGAATSAASRFRSRAATRSPRSVRFMPLYPLDPGREYDVVFDPSRLPRADVPRLPAVRKG